MMKNPVKRNRNIGTSKQGHGQDNRLWIPESWHDRRIFYEKLRSPVRLKRTVSGKEFVFLVEGTLEDYRHSCTVDDICCMLGHVPRNDLYPLDVIVLRQPTRKQKILSNVWGRLCYYFEAHQCSGVAIVLESQPINRTMTESTSLSLERRKEMDRLAADGHDVSFGRKRIAIRSDLDACRNTQLFRTIPHELGHYRHYRQTESERDFDTIPHPEKEAAAHRYADELVADLKKKGKIPFERILSPTSLSRDQLKRSWFE